MSLKIRLSRGGAKKRAFYRIVVADARMPRDGRFVEKIGTFDPLKAKDDAGRLVLDQEKAKAWLAKGAQPTDRVLRLLDGLGLAKREARSNPLKAKPKKKAQERAAAAAAAAAKAAEAPDEPAGARARPSHPDGRVRRAAGRTRRDAGQVADPRSQSYRRLRVADRRPTRAHLRLRVAAPVQGRHAGRAGQGRFDARGRRGADRGRDLRPPRPIAAAERRRILL